MTYVPRPSGVGTSTEVGRALKRLEHGLLGLSWTLCEAMAGAQTFEVDAVLKQFLNDFPTVIGA